MAAPKLTRKPAHRPRYGTVLHLQGLIDALKAYGVPREAITLRQVDDDLVVVAKYLRFLPAR
jgi:hypothetical protein